MSETLEIAPLRENELSQLFGLAKMAFASASGWNDRRVLQVLRHDIVFVAHEHGEVGGYVALLVSAGKEVIAEQVFVAPGHEHRGIGHRLLAHAEGYAIAKRARTLCVVVEPDNWRARAFYSRLGFVPVQPDLVELVLPSVV